MEDGIATAAWHVIERWSGEDDEKPEAKDKHTGLCESTSGTEAAKFAVTR